MLHIQDRLARLKTYDESTSLLNELYTPAQTLWSLINDHKAVYDLFADIVSEIPVAPNGKKIARVHVQGVQLFASSSIPRRVYGWIETEASVIMFTASEDTSFRVLLEESDAFLLKKYISSGNSYNVVRRSRRFA